MKYFFWIFLFVKFCEGQYYSPQQQIPPDAQYNPQQISQYSPQQLQQVPLQGQYPAPQTPENVPLGLLTGNVDDVTNLLKERGYESEVHRIETEDGYRLKVHRIKPKIQKEKRGPVLLCHGLFGTAADFLLMSQDVSLGYTLANDGYDVYMVNVRGSKYSMRHRLLFPTSPQFWMFSFNEIGMFDYSAAIDYILRITSKTAVYFVGHNQAGSALLALLSQRPQYNPKIAQAHLMAPIAWMDNIHPMIAFNIDRKMQSSYVTRTYNFYSLTEFLNATMSTYCNPSDPSALMYCMNLWFYAFGRNRNGTEMNPMNLLLIPKHISPTASTRQWNHYLQIYKRGRFQTYDGSEDSYYEGYPTEYNLLNVKVPMYLYHAAEDLVVSKMDVDHLMTAIAPIVKSYKTIANWNHADFILSQNARIMVYDYMLNQFNADIDFIVYLKNLMMG